VVTSRTRSVHAASAPISSGSITGHGHRYLRDGDPAFGPVDARASLRGSMC
jgi:hypothetical protein